MYLFEIVYIFIFTTTLNATTASESCISHGGSTVKRNMYMKGQSFRKMKLMSMTDCAVKCIMSSACKSFNFDLITSTCHLNRNSSDMEELQSKPGIIFSDIHLWPMKTAGRCSSNMCVPGEECDVDSRGKIVCTPEFLGCGVPPVVANGKVSYEDLVLNAEAVYTCDGNFRSCGSSDPWRVKCLSSGSWESKFSTCERYRWINEPVISFTSLPCGSTDRMKLTWNGVPQKRTSFTCWVMAGTTITFHIDIRFKCVTCKKCFIKCVVLNTWDGGKWDTEHTVAKFPFKMDRMFRMDISLQKGIYKVLVNHGVLTSFTERYKGVKPQHFSIRGDVLVKNVVIQL